LASNLIGFVVIDLFIGYFSFLESNVNNVKCSAINYYVEHLENFKIVLIEPNACGRYKINEKIKGLVISYNKFNPSYKLSICVENDDKKCSEPSNKLFKCLIFGESCPKYIDLSFVDIEVVDKGNLLFTFRKQGKYKISFKLFVDDRVVFETPKYMVEISE